MNWSWALTSTALLYAACGLFLAGWTARDRSDDLPLLYWLRLAIGWPYFFGRGALIWLHPRLADAEVRLLARLVRWAVVRLEDRHGCRVELDRPGE